MGQRFDQTPEARPTDLSKDTDCSLPDVGIGIMEGADQMVCAGRSFQAKTPQPSDGSQADEGIVVLEVPEQVR